MITSLYQTDFKYRLNIFAIIFLSIFTAILIVFVNGLVAIGLFLCVMLWLYLKKIENIFLMWLLFFPVFSIDYFSFLKISSHPILTFDRVVIGALLLFVLVEVAMRKRALLSMNGLGVAMIFFSAIIIYSIIHESVDKFRGGRIFLDSFLLPFIIFFLAKNLISEKENLKKFINVLLIMGIYLSLMGIFEYIAGSDILAFREGMVERSGWLRVNGPFKDDAAFGVNVSFCFFIALYKLITCSNCGFMNIRKAFYSLILVLFILAIIFNFYRGIWLALIVGLLVWFFIRKKTLNKLVIAIIILGIILIPFLNRIKTTRFYEERLTQKGTLQSRLDKFDESLYLFKMDPYNGIGFSNWYEIEKGQHNTFLAFLSETGILGIVSFMMLTWFLYYYSFRSYKLSKSQLTNEFSMIFICILICYSVTWMGLNTGFSASINKLFFSIAGVSLGILKNS